MAGLLKPSQRQELRDAVARLADAIASGEVTPSAGELEALSIRCDEQHLHPEAARVRRWVGGAGTHG